MPRNRSRIVTDIPAIGFDRRLIDRGFALHLTHGLGQVRDGGICLRDLIPVLTYILRVLVQGLSIKGGPALKRIQLLLMCGSACLQHRDTIPIDENFGV